MNKCTESPAIRPGLGKILKLENNVRNVGRIGQEARRNKVTININASIVFMTFYSH